MTVDTAGPVRIRARHPARGALGAGGRSLTPADRAGLLRRAAG
ncbi:hypothetical protein ACF1AE_02580 [Streptomyces sp. NPDC014986]